MFAFQSAAQDRFLPPISKVAFLTAKFTDECAEATSSQQGAKKDKTRSKKRQDVFGMVVELNR